MVNEFCGFKHGVIGTDKLPADTTLNNMKKADLIKLLHTAQHNYESLMWFYNNAVKANMAQLDNNGWIPCSERLPSERDWYLAVFKEADSDFILVPRVADYIGKETVCTTSEGWLIIDLEDEIGINAYYKKLVCIAWQPLPQPYEPKEDKQK